MKKLLFIILLAELFLANNVNATVKTKTLSTHKIGAEITRSGRKEAIRRTVESTYDSFTEEKTCNIGIGEGALTDFYINDNGVIQFWGDVMIQYKFDKNPMIKKSRTWTSGGHPIGPGITKKEWEPYKKTRLRETHYSSIEGAKPRVGDYILYNDQIKKLLNSYEKCQKSINNKSQSKEKGIVSNSKKSSEDKLAILAVKVGMECELRKNNLPIETLTEIRFREILSENYPELLYLEDWSKGIQANKALSLLRDYKGPYCNKKLTGEFLDNYINPILSQ